MDFVLFVFLVSLVIGFFVYGIQQFRTGISYVGLGTVLFSLVLCIMLSLFLVAMNDDIKITLIESSNYSYESISPMNTTGSEITTTIQREINTELEWEFNPIIDRCIDEVTDTIIPSESFTILGFHTCENASLVFSAEYTKPSSVSWNEIVFSSSSIISNYSGGTPNPREPQLFLRIENQDGGVVVNSLLYNRGNHNERIILDLSVITSDNIRFVITKSLLSTSQNTYDMSITIDSILLETSETVGNPNVNLQYEKQIDLLQSVNTIDEIIMIHNTDRIKSLLVSLFSGISLIIGIVALGMIFTMFMKSIDRKSA